MEVCNIMSTVVENRRMNDLGQEMKLNVDWKVRKGVWGVYVCVSM